MAQHPTFDTVSSELRLSLKAASVPSLKSKELHQDFINKLGVGGIMKVDGREYAILPPNNDHHQLLPGYEAEISLTRNGGSVAKNGTRIFDTVATKAIRTNASREDIAKALTELTDGMPPKLQEEVLGKFNKANPENIISKEMLRAAELEKERMSGIVIPRGETTATNSVPLDKARVASAVKQ